MYATVGRAQYAFDLYTLPAESDPVEANAEIQVTDGVSVNFNGAWYVQPGSWLPECVNNELLCSLSSLSCPAWIYGYALFCLDPHMPSAGTGISSYLCQKGMATWSCTAGN